MRFQLGVRVGPGIVSARREQGLAGKDEIVAGPPERHDNVNVPI